MTLSGNLSKDTPTAAARLRVVGAAAALIALLPVTAAAASADGPARSGSAAASSLDPSSLGHLDPGLTTVGSALQQVLVTARNGVPAAAEAVRAAGGRVTTALPLVDGVAAAVPADRLDQLAQDPAVLAVTEDRQAHFSSTGLDATTTASSFVGSTGAAAAWQARNLGKGVGIAVLDTGVSAMDDFAGRLVHGPDLSGEGTTVDTHGHGTVMAGVAAGSGAASAGARGGAHTGVAPEATVVAVKVAGRNGAVDVSTMLQAMHWVSAYADQYGIRVLNLSWGTESTQDPAVDPLNHAVQRLWQQGIVVVVAAGNSGPRGGTITKPGDDPMVLTVGAFDDKGDGDDRNDVLAPWSSRGPTARGVAKPDLVAPGRTLVAVRSFGSEVEAQNPKALVGTSYVRGSGTSQAAAVVSGLAALVVAEHPTWTPDQVKRALTSTAAPLTSAAIADQGAGRVRLDRALVAEPGPATWQSATATGLGSLEGSRGGSHVEVVCPGDTTPTVVQGERDARYEAWNGSRWTGSRWTGEAWTGSRWTADAWTGSRWTGSRWTGGEWASTTWAGAAWTASPVSDSAWTGSRWTGSRWTGSRWTGSRWTGSRWTGSRWTSTSDVTHRDNFLTAFWGQRPPAGLTLPGESNDSQ